MNRKKLTEHLSVAEIEQRYRQSSDGVARTHWQIVWLRAQGKPTEEVAALTGYSLGWVRQIVRRYNQQGPDGLGDQRHDNPGGQFLLTPEQQAALKEALSGSAPDAGLWNSRTVAAWMSEQLGCHIRRQRGWDYLRRLDFTLQRPRRRHKKADPDAQAAFKGGHSPTP